MQGAGARGPGPSGATSEAATGAYTRRLSLLHAGGAQLTRSLGPSVTGTSRASFSAGMSPRVLGNSTRGTRRFPSSPGRTPCPPPALARTTRGSVCDASLEQRPALCQGLAGPYLWPCGSSQRPQSSSKSSPSSCSVLGGGGGQNGPKAPLAPQRGQIDPGQSK